MKKEEKPKIKITGKATTSGGGSKSVKPGAMNQSTKTVKSKPTAKSYSPAPMSAKAKAKIRVAAAKKKPTLVSKVKAVVREARDIPTAVGTIARAAAAGKPKAGTNTPINKQGMYAKYDLKNQVKEVKDAIKYGKKGTGAVLYGKGKKEYRNQPKKK